ncbi:family 78 glycoside hydrolase catalytic domain [Aerococcaceae bacterium zg-ZJ1578]|uniref:family 78 glycoside hydrolase catalytic domain n=1 Tax=Aerococcaceae bacterium zg-252 TaxID=2796928 RepID=UPI001A288FF5|nr:family 78 glycoside hydrolase catalytic domain [Aerococcaceae bacterium zg-1578]
MNISSIKINHLIEPLGFDLNGIRIDFKVESDEFEQIQKQLIIKDAEQIVYQTEHLPFDNNYFIADFALKPRTRYNVTINLTLADGSHVHQNTFFETGKMNEPFTAKWIANQDKEIQNTLFKKEVIIDKPIAKARLYMTALGVYETYIDEQKVGNEYLAPGQTAYDEWVQVQTYDVTNQLTLGQHELLISTADGWYKGAYGFIAGKDCIYGDQHRALAEYHIEYVDGSTEIIQTDDSWLTTSGKVTKSAIYYGEDLDDTIVVSNWEPVQILDASYEQLTDRLSLPLVEKEILSVKEVIQSPKGETILDFGQNHAGIFTFYNREPKGTKITLQVSEILQDGNFYRDNLREARAAFEYISDGVEKWVTPRFTYYGYRYIKVEGLTQSLNPDDFKAKVIYSDMESIGQIRTQNEKVNRLFENVIWGQKSNFFDVPTDCPQRDERLGWTGDANVFSTTALHNMDAFAFYRKYLKDIAIEQELNDGRAPMYAPSFGNPDGGGAIWGDAVTFIPWNTYLATGDNSLLIEYYDSMKHWVDWITRNTKTKNLWTGCFQFGDWLALDGENPAMPTGKTDEDFIASIYYHYSAHIVAETAKMLNLSAEAEHYATLSAAIKAAIQDEYISKNGRLTIDTQTAYALALQFELLPEEQNLRVVNDLMTRLHKDDDHLKTGFVGTPYLNKMLSKFGQHKLATKIFLHEDYPSWLYAVNLGATTVWERWNSVEADGSMNPEGMNSLNHYSIGAIMDWGYQYVLGIRNPHNGYQTFDIAPEFDYRLSQVSGYFDSPYGKINVAYQIETNKDHLIKLSIDVPFGSQANVVLPRSKESDIHINHQLHSGEQILLNAGHYEIEYIPQENYIERYSRHTSIVEIFADSELVQQIDEIDPVLNFFKNDADALNGGLGKMSLTKVNSILPFINITDENLEKINVLLESTPILAQRK